MDNSTKNYNLLFYIEFQDGAETKQVSFADHKGVTIPNAGDYFAFHRQRKIIQRTFAYSDTGLTVYFLCGPPE